MAMTNTKIKTRTMHNIMNHIELVKKTQEESKELT